MIESQTKLPMQEEGSARGSTKGRRVVSAAVERVQSWAQDLPRTRIVGAWDQVSPLVRNLDKQLSLRSLFTRVRNSISSIRGEGSLLSRYALHLVVVLLAVGVVGVSQVTLPQIDFELPTPTPAPDLGSHAVAEAPTNRGGSRFVTNAASLFQAPVAHTTLADWDRMQIITYTVKANDNVWAIAQGFGLQAETVLWANSEVESQPDLLRVGQQLIILPVDGVYYQVQKGDTLESIAKKFKITADKIAEFKGNDLEEPYALAAGQKLVLPGGKKEMPRINYSNYYPMTQVGSAPAGAVKGSGRFAWPTRGTLSQLYWSGHPAIDVANRTGTPILAADDGYVVMSGRDTWGYGNQVVIDHGNGVKTRYAHLNTILVKAGQSVKKNQQIGTMGSTGRSTGPHLHFEIIVNDVRRNPMGYLP